MLITANEAAKELLSHDHIMLISHASPDGDTLGCSFALYHALTALGKRVKVRCSDPLPERFSFLFEGYIDNDFAEKYVVAVDVAATQLFGQKLSGYQEKVDLCIDHHPSNELYAKMTLLNHHVAAACELVYEVITFLRAEITKQMANCIYTGIATDSGCFKYSNTTANSHIIAAKMFECGADYEEINRFLFDTKSKSRVAIEQKVLQSMEYFCGDKIAIIGISQKMVEESHADESELDGVSALPRSIEGVEIGITMRERPDGMQKVSIRTAGSVDASQICMQFGGGGHKRAAGCLISQSYEDAKRVLVETAAEYLRNQK